MKWFYLALIFIVMIIGGIMLMFDYYLWSALCFGSALFAENRLSKKDLLPKW